MDREQLSNAGATRTSHWIKRRPAVNVHHAQRYSEMIGLPLRIFVTINFTLIGVPAGMAVQVFRKILTQRFAPWLRRCAANRRVVAPTYVWVMEAASSHLAVHWLLHVPPELLKTFRAKLLSWLSAASDHGALAPRAVKFQDVYSVIGMRRYMLKGTDPAWAKHLGVTHVPQGIVIGKRSGFSKNLGPTARKSGGYSPRRLPLEPFAA